LNERAGPISEDALPIDPQPLAIGGNVRDDNVALLLTEEDLHPESWSVQASVKGIGVLGSAFVGAEDGPARRFSNAALLDAATRATAHFGAQATQVDIVSIIGWAQSLGVKEIVTGYAPVGLIAQQLDAVAAALAAQGIRLTRLQRDWDKAAWPHARAGFFKLKTRIPHLIAGLG
jgi:deoxyribodipyrimidine photo-lyase